MKGPWTLVLQLCGLLALTEGVHLNQENLKRIQNYLNSGHIVRTRRQVLQNPLPWPGPPSQARVLNVPIPTNIPFFPAGGQAPPADNCPRHQIQMETDGSCQDPLDQGSCGQNEQALLDPETNRGYCAPRLCPVDRIFLHSTQLCHDPRQMDACPAGRELYYTAFGTPVCTCPDGTIESDDDFDDDVCEVILSKSLQCLYGQVYFFKDINSPPQCIPDPCGGRNLRRNANELPFVPSERDGTCYKLGESAGVCPYDQYYSLNFLTLRGKCATLEEAGYTVYDDQTLAALNGMYGPPIPEGGFPAGSQAGVSSGFNGGQGFTGSQHPHNAGHNNQQLGQNVGGNFIHNNVFGNDHLSNQISTTTFSTGQSNNIGGGSVQQSFPTSFSFHSTNQGQNSNTGVSHQQTNLQQASNQHNNAGSYSVSFGGNNGQQNGGVSPQQTQNTIGVTTNVNSGQAIQSTNNDQYNNHQTVQQPHVSQNIFSGQQSSTGFNQHQSSNNFQHTHGSNNQQTNFGSIQNSHQPTSSINSFQQSIEAFEQGNISPHNHQQAGGTGLSNLQYGNNQNIGGNQQQQSIEVFGQGSLSSQNHQQAGGIGHSNQQYGINQHQSVEVFGQGSLSSQNHQQAGGIGHNNQQYGTNQHQSIEVFGQGSLSSQNHQQTGGIGHNNQQYGINEPQSIEVFGQGSLSPQNQQQAGGIGHNNQQYGINQQQSIEVFGHQSLAQQAGGTGQQYGIQEPVSVEVFGANAGFNSPEVFGAGGQQQSIEVVGEKVGSKLGRSFGLQEPAVEARLAAAWHIHPNGRVEHRIRRSDRSIFDSNTQMSSSLQSDAIRSRKKRNALPHASPSNVFESRLLSCKPGQARDVNAKCRNTILPAAVPKSRGTRAAPPIPPTPSCGQGMAFNIRRMCVPSNNAQNSITAFNLG